MLNQRLEELNHRMVRNLEKISGYDFFISEPANGYVCFIKISNDDKDVIKSVRVIVQGSYGGSYAVRFDVYGDIPLQAKRKVDEKHFDNARDAFFYIVDVAQKINRFFKEL